jgi:transposase-like protein
MPGPRSPRVIALSEEARAELIRLTRSPSVAAGLARRARIVLLAAEGMPIRHIGPRVGVSRTVVRDWLDRFRTRGLAGLQDQPRSGRPRTFSP